MALDTATRPARSLRRPPGARFALALVRRETAGTIAVFVLFLALWQWGPGALGIPSYIVPTASECWLAFVRMLGRDRLMFHVGVTALEVAAGFGRAHCSAW